MSEFKTLKTAYDEGRTLSSVSSNTIIAVHNPAESTTKTTTIGVVETYIEGNITPAGIGAATSDHTHSGVYEPANSNIQAHVVSTHAPSNAVSLATVKADTDIASAVSLKHSHDNSVALAAVSGTNTGDETKASIESKLTGEISSHTHASSGGTTDHSALSNLAYADSGHTGFQASETGKGLSTNDLTNALKTNYDAAYTHSTSSHAPSNAVSLATVKADTDIASAVSLKHSHDNSVALAAVSGTNTGDETKASIESKLTGEISSHTHAGSGGTTDHSALSNLDYASSGHTGFQASETGKGLSTNDLTNTLKTNYDAAYTHSTSSHAPSDAVSLATVKADTDIASAISDDHTHTNATALNNVSGINTGDQDLSGYSLTSHNHSGVYAPVLGADDNYVTNAEKTKLANLSGTNTGDETKASIESKLTGEISSHTHAGSGGTTDHSALSNLAYADSGHTGFQASESGKGLSTNDLTNTLKTNYDAAYTHSTSAHAPSNAVALATVKADTDISSAISNSHTHTNAAALANVSGTNTGDQDLSGYSLTSHNHDSSYEAKNSAIMTHVNNTSGNPHNTTKSLIGLGNLENYAIASQVEAQSGTANDRYMTPLRVKEAIDVFASDAGEVNTGTNLGEETDGYGWYSNKSGVALQFRRIKAGNRVTLSAADNNITVTADVQTDLNFTQSLKDSYDLAYTHSNSAHAPSGATVVASDTNGNILINGVSTSVYAHPSAKQCSYSYTHPAEKQCSYAYSHPEGKQCTWIPEAYVHPTAKQCDYSYTHPATHDATIINQTSSYRFVTDIEKGTWNSKADASHGTHVSDVTTGLAASKVLARNSANDGYEWISQSGGGAGVWGSITGTLADQTDLATALSGKADTSHVHGNITNAGAIGTTASLPVITTTSGVLTTGSFGTTVGTFCQGNDSRLSDARTPASHNNTYHSETYITASGVTYEALNANSDVGTGSAQVAAGNHTHSSATTSAAGFMSAADKTKLNGIATGATANTGTVTSVGKGDGMNFTAFTTSGTVTLGTPSSITSTSTNAVQASSHTHAIDATIVTTTGSQTLTNKTITGAVISQGSIDLSGSASYTMKIPTVAPSSPANGHIWIA